jgi:hypothetical protein
MKLIVAIVAVVLGLATTVLWLRVRELEKSVDIMAQQLPVQPQAIPAVSAQPPQQQAAEKQRIFKLIESPPTNGSTEVGVPWSVERGMMIDAAQRARPIPQVENGPPEYKSEGAPLFDASPDVWELEQPPTESASDDGMN